MRRAFGIIFWSILLILTISIGIELSGCSGGIINTIEVETCILAKSTNSMNEVYSITITDIYGLPTSGVIEISEEQYSEIVVGKIYKLTIELWVESSGAKVARLKSFEEGGSR